MAPLDILAAAGLVNHFGRVQENDKITVRPILLRKGSTMLALYGFANVRDERLFRTFQSGNVNFVKPQTGEDQCFNLLAVHQNHVAHTSTSFLPETFLPDFLDFVVWGHEHDCIAEPIKNPHTGFYVLQPGSSVATSLIEGEAIPKHVFILSVKGKQYSLEKIRLMTVRPFAIGSVNLREDTDFTTGASERAAIIEWLNQKVEELIERAINEWRERPGNEDESIEPPLPLIRLKVDYSGGYELENPRRFSNRFIHRVANVNDVVTFHRKRITGATTKSINGKNVKIGEAEPHVEGIDKVRIQSLVESFLEKDGGLQILPENGLGDAIKDFVEKDDKDALKTFVQNSLAIQLDSLMNIEDIDEESLPMHISKTKDTLVQETTKKSAGRPKSVDKSIPPQIHLDPKLHVEDEGDDIIDDQFPELPQTEIEQEPPRKSRAGVSATTRTVTTTRATRGKTTTRNVKRISTAQKPRSSAKTQKDYEDEDLLLDSSDEDESEGYVEVESPKKAPKRSRASTTTKRATTTRATKKQQTKAVPKTTRGRKAVEPPISQVYHEVVDSDDSDDIIESAVLRSNVGVRAAAEDTIVTPTRNDGIDVQRGGRVIRTRTTSPSPATTTGQKTRASSLRTTALNNAERNRKLDTKVATPSKRKYEEPARQWNQNDEDLLFDDDDGFS